MANPKIIPDPPAGASLWFEHDIPVTMGVDNLMFRTGKMLLESYYNGFLSAHDGCEDCIAFYEWQDVDTNAKLIKLKAYVAHLHPELKPLETGDMKGRTEVTHLLGDRNAKQRAKSAAASTGAAEEAHEDELFLSEATMALDALRREYVPGQVSTRGYIAVQDTAPVIPPPPKSPPPPTL
jgi:hypothetical protein